MRIAVIDMGTNTFNLLIAEINQNKNFKIVFKDKAGVKLGRGGINQKIITPEAFQRGINAIEKHLKTIERYNADKIFATATSSIRSAQNGKEFVETLERQFNIKIRIISGDEEAELIYRGVKQTVDFNNENILILDIGGGSNEFIIANNSGLQWKKSFDLGMARLLDKFNPSDPITPSEVAAVENYIDINLVPLYDAVKKYKPVELIGCSGTFDSLRAMILAKNGTIPAEIKKQNHYTINLNNYNKLHQELIKSTTADRLKMEGLEPVRLEMIVLASIFVNFILQKLPLKKIIQSNFAIKEGLIDKILNNKI